MSQEARQLVADGVKEINLISQDSTYYGLDLRPNHSRIDCVAGKFNAAAQVAAGRRDHSVHAAARAECNRGDFWIRLLYTHPAHWTDELIQTIAECPKVARYVDMPLQHIHENMLERMRRETSQQYIVDLIRRIRPAFRASLCARRSLLAFPARPEAYFETLLDFIREAKFERLGVFTYSQEEGTRAGGMARQISEKMKQRRRERRWLPNMRLLSGLRTFYGTPT